jgi:endonuclease/exonuclease/phosphatase family metal-dependent hydrolase
MRHDVFQQLINDGFDGVFAPQWNEVISGKIITIGSAILSSQNVSKFENIYFRGNPSNVPDFDDGRVDQACIPRAIQKIELDYCGTTINIMNLHFTWSAAGQASDLQRADILKIRGITSAHKKLVICGDFNAPVGGEILDKLQESLKLSIPCGLTTSIDPQFHYAKDLQIVVDAMFHSGDVAISKIDAKFGVSDHCALIASLSI